VEESSRVVVLVANDLSGGAMELVEAVELLASKDGVDRGWRQPQLQGEMKRSSSGATPELTGLGDLLGAGCSG
jgi:hypothetical protein